MGSTLALSLVACGGSVAVDGSGGEGTTSSSSTSTTSSSSTSSGSSSCVAPAPLSGLCAPGAACAANGSTCLSSVDQSTSSTPGLRMSGLRFTKPSAFTTGIVTGVIGGAVSPNDPKCNLNGSGTFSWLLRFDLAAGKLTTGGSKPSIDSAGPYAFVNQTLTSGGTPFDVQPVTLDAPLAGDCGFTSSAGDVNIPIYLDAAASSVLLLPLRALRFSGGKLTPDHGCIGRYNAEGLDPASACLDEPPNPSFLPGADVDALMVLEEADKVVIEPLSQSLCVLISQDAPTYGTKNPQGVTVCKRDAANKIIFEGDWCAATNQAATAACSDAARVSASFAAQGVQIL